MKEISDVLGVLDLGHKRSLRLGLLLLSSIVIIAGSALAFAGVVYQRPLIVGNAGSVTTGPGSGTSAGTSVPPAALAILALSGLIISISIFNLLRRAFARVNGSAALEITGGSASMSADLPLSLHTAPGAEWEESPSTDEKEEQN